MRNFSFWYRGQYSARFGPAHLSAAAKWTAIAILSLMAGPAPASAQALPPPTNTINGFITCVNDNILKPAAEKKVSVDISDTVACIPSDCSVTATQSEDSDQPACKRLAGLAEESLVRFPRLILYCPGTTKDIKFVPSYTLCPELGHRGLNNMELAEIHKPDPLTNTGAMIMAKLTLEPGEHPKDFELKPNDLKNRVTNGKPGDVGSKDCNSCHFDGTPRTLPQPGEKKALLLAQPLSPFRKGTLRRNNKAVDPKVVFTTQPNQSANNNIEASPSGICGNISFNEAGLRKAVPDPKSLDVTLKLCPKLMERSLFINVGGIKAAALASRSSIPKLGHNQTGKIVFLVANDKKESMELGLAVAPPTAARYLSGDKKDDIKKNSITVKGDTCKQFGKLPPGQPCTVTVTFDTGPGDPDQKKDPDFGIWDIVTKVTLTDPKGNTYDLLPAATVQVGP